MGLRGVPQYAGLYTMKTLVIGGTEGSVLGWYSADLLLAVFLCWSLLRARVPSCFGLSQGWMSLVDAWLIHRD